jgi:hypothetical protein
VATQDPLRQRALVVPDKAQRVTQFHGNTLEALRELLQAVGLSHPSQLRPHHIMRRLSASESRPLSEVYRFLPPGALLEADGASRCGSVFETWWARARPDSFHPAARL